MSGLKKNVVRTMALMSLLAFTGTMMTGCGKKEDDDASAPATKKDSTKTDTMKKDNSDSK